VSAEGRSQRILELMTGPVEGGYFCAG